MNNERVTRAMKEAFALAQEYANEKGVSRANRGLVLKAFQCGFAAGAGWMEAEDLQKNRKRNDN